MNRASGMRTSSIRGGGLGPQMPSMARTLPGGMGDWWSDITSSVTTALNPANWNLNPVYSPIYQSTVAPALNVAGAAVGTALVGAPIPLGTITTGLLGGTVKPTPAQPYSPVYSQPAAPASAPAAPAPTAAATPKSNMPIYIGIAAVVGVMWWANSSKPKPRDQETRG